MNSPLDRRLKRKNNKKSLISLRNLRKQNFAKKPKVALPFTKDLYPFLQNLLGKYGILTIPQKQFKYLYK